MPEESQLQMFQTLSVWTPCADRNSLGLPPIHLCPSAAPPSNPASHQALFSLTTMSNPSNILAGRNPVKLLLHLSPLFFFCPAPSLDQLPMSIPAALPTNEAAVAHL